MNLSTVMPAISPTKLKLLVLGAMFLVAGLVAGPFASSASAVTCRQYNEAAPFNGFGYYDSKTWYGKGLMRIVPGSATSSCAHINVTNINGGVGTGGHCAYFHVLFYSTSDVLLYTTAATYVCATTAVVAIATDVINGTHYMIEGGLPGYNPTNSPSLSWTVRD